MLSAGDATKGDNDGGEQGWGYGSLGVVRQAELQMQLLSVIGKLTERNAPLSYLSFDGHCGCIALQPLARFPSAKTGYSISCWMQVNTFFGQVPPPLCVNIT